MRVIWPVAAAAMLAACGPDPGPLGWIDARSAVVHCTSAGRDRMPPVLLGLPVPTPPTGLYARRMDPMALDDLGFQRDTVACAMLQPPDTDGSTVGQALVEVREEATRAAASLAGKCACEAASRLDARALLPNCVDEPTRRSCEVEDQLEPMREILAPVQAAIAQTQVPLVHWRLVGKTDRPGWFVRKQNTLLERHEGGSTVFVPGQPMPQRDNAALIEALLEHDDVVAVVRQDSGQALLVVREIDKTLILDHFEHPAVGDTLTPLLPFLDNASVARYRALLAKPTQTRKLGLAPGKGNLVEVDVSHLQNVDDSIRAGATLFDLDAGPKRELPPRRVELVTAQAPFGKQGRRLDVRVELTDAGRQWAALLTDEDLAPGLGGLGLETVQVEPPPGELPYLLAGSAFERTVVYGLELVPGLMGEVEDRYPGSIGGTGRAWSFTMPLSTMEGLVESPLVFSGLRGAFAERLYEVDVEVAEQGRVLQASIQPE